MKTKNEETCSYKVGDDVYISTLGPPRIPRLVKVESVGRVYVFADGYKFRASTGALASGYTGWIKPRAVYEEKIEREKLVSRLRDLLPSLSLPTLQKMLEVIP